MGIVVVVDFSDPHSVVDVSWGLDRRLIQVPI